MIHRLKKIAAGIVATCNVIVIILMTVTGYSGYINPETFKEASVWSLIFPFFLVADIAFIVLWFFTKKKMMLLPVAGLLICAAPVRTYCPLNLPEDVPEDAIKVLTYNTLYFGYLTDYDFPDIPVLEYIRDCDADIVCLQESAETCVSLANVQKMLNKYDFIDKIDGRGRVDYDLLILSKFPIKKQYVLPIKSVSNIAAAFWLDVNGEEMIVINAHLESYDLSEAEINGYVDMLKGIKNNSINKDSLKNESLFLSRRLSETNAIRAGQAKVLADFIEKNKDKSILLCGDFNDSPLSYTNQIIGRKLNNCYVASGNGPGWSYNEKGFKFRIDNIFCTHNWKAYGAKVDHTAEGSDHYPLFCWIKKR